MSANEPFVRIGLKEVYDKLCAVERDVTALKLAEATRSDAARDRYRHKMLLYPTCATAVAGLATAVVAMVK